MLMKSRAYCLEGGKYFSKNISLTALVLFFAVFVVLPHQVSAQVLDDDYGVVEGSTDLEGVVADVPDGSVDDGSVDGGGVMSDIEKEFEELLEKNKKPVASEITPESVQKKKEEDDLSPFNPSKIPSLFFTYWQHELIADAKRARGSVRGVRQQDLDKLNVNKTKPEDRDLMLSGILYHGEDDWIIWLNGLRITPNAIPEEVMELRVYKTYIEVKWLDPYTEQIFPIRLRPHQRFNLDARIFLPG